jgi:AcrR family transcriptional regulator
MPYPAHHRANVRQRIVDSARHLFNRRGFEGVSISQIMAGAKLTHGGFYNYFKSKSELYAEVLGCFLTDPNWKHCWEGITVDLTSTDAGAQVVNAYLSRQHFDDVENSCPMTVLPTDVSRSGPKVKSAFEDVFRAMVSVLERSMRPSGGPPRVRAQAITALCVGGMVLARALADRDRADALRAASQQVALELGGWASKRVRGQVPRRLAKTRPTASRPT